MEDTDRERDFHQQFFEKARGDVLSIGLGLGFIIRPLFDNGLVDRLTIVEKNIEVIDMVWPHYAEYSDRVELIHVDATTWEPGQRTWDVGWVDVWDKDSPSEHRRIHWDIMRRLRPFCTELLWLRLKALYPVPEDWV